MSLPVPKKSTRKGKKLMISQGNKTIHFGAVGYSDFPHHKDSQRRKNFYQRHFHTSNPDIPEIRRICKEKLKKGTATAKCASAIYLW